ARCAHFGARELVLDAGRAHVAEAALDELGLELLAEDPAPRDELVGVARIRAPAPVLFARGNAHAHRRAALEADHDDLAPAREVRLNGSGDDDSRTPAVPPERERV